MTSPLKLIVFLPEEDDQHHYILNLNFDVSQMSKNQRAFQNSYYAILMAFFYHSNTKPPGIVGLMEIIEKNLIDPFQFDESSKYFDKNSKSHVP